jgi:CTP:molybdopterin cytidylyltransferase MocA
MGVSKPLMDFDGVSVLERMVDAFRGAGLARIRVIGRENDHDLAESALALGAAYIVNPRPDLGMAGSALVALDSADSTWLAICPADMPLLTTEPIEACVAALEGDVVQPSCEGRPKHPVFLSRAIAPIIRTRLQEGFTLRDALPKPDERRLVPVDNPAQFCDVDTPEDVVRLLRGKIAPHSAE